MEQPEAKLYKAIHKKLDRGLVDAFKMHNTYARGMPDCWYSGAQNDLWVEYKWGSNGLSDHQQLWLTNQQKRGRNVAIILGHLDGTVSIFSGPEVIDWKPRVRLPKFTKAEAADWITEMTHGL